MKKVLSIVLILQVLLVSVIGIQGILSSLSGKIRVEKVQFHSTASLIANTEDGIEDFRESNRFEVEDSFEVNASLISLYLNPNFDRRSLQFYHFENLFGNNSPLYLEHRSLLI